MTTPATNPTPEVGVTVTPSTGVKTTTLSTPTTAAAGGYQTYTNRRFGYTVEIPSGYTPDNQPADGTGHKYTSPDHAATVELTAEHNGDGHSIADEYAQALAIDGEDGAQITYKVLHENVFTISGFIGSRHDIFYDVVYLGPNSIDRMEWTYPTGLPRVWLTPDL